MRLKQVTLTPGWGHDRTNIRVGHSLAQWHERNDCDNDERTGTKGRTNDNDEQGTSVSD